MSLHWKSDQGDTERTRILVGTVLEVEIGPKATALGRRMNFFCCNILPWRIIHEGGNHQHKECQPHTTEPPCTSTGGGGGERAAAATTNTTGNTTVTDPVSVQFFEVPETDPLNYEAFRVVVTQPTAEMPGRPLSLLT